MEKLDFKIQGIYIISFSLVFKGLIDLSIGSTENKYIKLNIKAQNIFCCVNENLTTFLYTLTGGTRKQKERKKVSFCKVYAKVEC